MRLVVSTVKICVALFVSSLTLEGIQSCPNLGPGSTLSTSVAGNTHLFVGDDLRLTCTLTPEHLQNYTTKNISFVFTQPQESNKASNVTCCSGPRSSMQVLNTTSVVLTIQNVTAQDIGQYTCFIGDNRCLKGQQNVCVVGISHDVKVDYRPQNVTDFHCVVYNWDYSMTCSWKHPVDYVDLSDIIVTSSFSLDGSDHYQSCPSLSFTSCSWDQFQTAFRYYVQVNVTNKYTNITTSKSFITDTFENVKPAPVENLTAKAATNQTGCLELSWTHSKPRREKLFRVKHQLVGKTNFYVLNDSFPNTTFMACNYQPYTHHNFSVEALPSSEYSGYWSDPVYIDARTPMTAPDSGPQTTNGSFTMDNTKLKCCRGLRNVTIMWQMVNESARNGIIDSYIIKMGETILREVQADIFSATVELDCSSSSILEIFAHNKGGISLKPSVLLIPATCFGVSLIVTVERINQKLVNVSWKGPPHMDYTIFWCEEAFSTSYRSCQTDKEVNWMDVPKGHTAWNISTPNSGNYIYGISATDNDTGNASEIFWANPPSTVDPGTTVPLGAALGGLASVMLLFLAVILMYRKCKSRKEHLDMMVSSRHNDFLDRSKADLWHLTLTQTKTTKQGKEPQHIPATNDASSLVPKKAHITANTDIFVKKSNFPKKGPFKKIKNSCPHSIYAGDFQSDLPSEKQPSQDGGKTKRPETLEMEAFSSDYVQQVVATSSKDGVCCREEPPSTKESEAGGSSTEQLEIGTVFANSQNAQKSVDSLRLSDDYIRVVEDQNEVDSCAEDYKLSDEESKTTDDTLSDQPVETQPNLQSISNSSLSVPTTLISKLASASKGVLVSLNLQTTNCCTDNTETNKGEHSSIVTVNLGEHSRMTEERFVNIGIKTSHTPTTLEIISETLTSERTSSESSGVSGVLLKPSNIGISCSIGNTYEYVPCTFHTSKFITGTSSNQQGPTNTMPHSPDYIQLNEVTGTNTESSNKSHSQCCTQDSLSNSNLNDYTGKLCSKSDDDGNTSNRQGNSNLNRSISTNTTQSLDYIQLRDLSNNTPDSSCEFTSHCSREEPCSHSDDGDT